jgi:hypothetical protein
MAISGIMDSGPYDGTLPPVIKSPRCTCNPFRDVWCDVHSPVQAAVEAWWKFLARKWPSVYDLE